jgi:hypothetical protein
MAIREALCGIETDENFVSLKLLIILSLLGWMNYEICSTFSDAEVSQKTQFENHFIDLVGAIITLVNDTLKQQDRVQRFALFDLREYDAPI